jgi:hypothetical protein
MRLTFPEPVILKRFRAPLCDFIFGIAVSWRMSIAYEPRPTMSFPL